MAYVFTNKTPTQLVFGSKDLEQASLQYPGWVSYQNGQAGEMFTVSDADFVLLQTQEKIWSHNGTNYVLLDSTRVGFNNNKEMMDIEINHRVNRINEILGRYESNSFGAELQAYKTVLQNLDTSSISYPLTTTLERYLINQGHPIVGYLQMV